MCRILYLKWTNTKKAISYIDAFFDAWFNDPHLNTWLLNKAWKDKNQHIHGWWYLFVTPDNIETYLNWNAFFQDKIWIENLKQKINSQTSEFMLMAELRLTDSWYISAFNSHPFSFSTRNWYEWLFFYNWVFDHNKLCLEEGIDYCNFYKKNSTTLLWHSISNQLEKWKTIFEAINHPKIALKTGYNIMMFLNDNLWNYKAIIHNYANPELLKNDEFYKTYISLIKKEEKDMCFIGSNAISCYKKDDYKYMENSEFLEFPINFIKEFYVDANTDFKL